MKCPYCGKEALTSVRTPWGGIFYACPCVPPNTAVQVRVDQLILDAVRGDVLTFMRVEHDAGDEDLRELDEDAECPMCNRPLREYSVRTRSRYHGRNVYVPLPNETWEDQGRAHLRVHNHYRCVPQAEAFAIAQTIRAHRRLFTAT